MKPTVINVSNKELVEDYFSLKSSYKVASKHNISPTVVKRILKEENVLRTKEQAYKERIIPNIGKYSRTEKHKKILSDFGKTRTGSKNPFFGKKHTEEMKQSRSKAMKEKVGKLNPNYKHGKNLRRPRDYKYAEFRPLRNFAFNRDKYTCFYCKKTGGHLHAHHILPYWVKPEAFFDVENLITLCTNCHMNKAHKGDWARFDASLASENLLSKYSLDRERLNELGDLHNKSQAIVRSFDISKTEEIDRNDLSANLIVSVNS